jgi:putative transcriptional regulator
MRTVAIAILVFCLGWMQPAGAVDVDIDRPLMLVAAPELYDPLYGATVLVVTPIGGDEHVGFIVNRPTTTRLENLFPEHAPSRKVADPVYLGGPVEPGVIFALVQRKSSPGGHSIEMAPGLYAAYEGAVVEGLIKSDPQRARFMAGLVAWRAGELREEIQRGAWYVLEPDAALVMRKPEGLWEELVRRSQRARNSI